MSFGVSIGLQTLNKEHITHHNHHIHLEFMFLRRKGRSQKIKEKRQISSLKGLGGRKKWEK